MLLINGHERDFMMERSKATYDAIDTLPAFYGARHGAGSRRRRITRVAVSSPMSLQTGCCGSSRATRRLGAMFVGAKCSLCTNSNWDTASKRLTK